MNNSFVLSWIENDPLFGSSFWIPSRSYVSNFFTGALREVCLICVLARAMELKNAQKKVNPKNTVCIWGKSLKKFRSCSGINRNSSSSELDIAVLLSLKKTCRWGHSAAIYIVYVYNSSYTKKWLQFCALEKRSSWRNLYSNCFFIHKCPFDESDMDNWTCFFFHFINSNGAV